jgi:hypothetical protein
LCVFITSQYLFQENYFCHTFVVFANFEKYAQKTKHFQHIEKEYNLLFASIYQSQFDECQVFNIETRLCCALAILPFNYLSTGPMVNRHCKKRLSFFPSPAGMSQTKLSLARKNLKLSAFFTMQKGDKYE